MQPLHHLRPVVSVMRVRVHKFSAVVNRFILRLIKLTAKRHLKNRRSPASNLYALTSVSP